MPSSPAADRRGDLRCLRAADNDRKSPEECRQPHSPGLSFFQNRFGNDPETVPEESEISNLKLEIWPDDS
jgi:hypothetical protein